jgi:hypothetical protein
MPTDGVRLDNREGLFHLAQSILSQLEPVGRYHQFPPDCARR